MMILKANQMMLGVMAALILAGILGTSLGHHIGQAVDRRIAAVETHLGLEWLR
jgi:hypothetical protein